MISSKSQKLKNPQDHNLTKDGVIWVISKLTKIRDQGVENYFFVVRFWICTCGV